MAIRKEAQVFTREDLERRGLKEGVHWYENHSGIILSLKANKKRKCPNCGKKDQSFYSALHETCRTCQRRMRDGVSIGSAAAAVRDIQYDGARARTNKEAQEIARKQVAAHQKELAARTLARRRLIHFIKRFQPGYMDGWVHHDICRRLERFSQAVVAGLSPRLLIFCPPRLGKSLIASQFFPAWHLGHNPSHEIIAASYNNSLPIGFSRRIRELARDPGYMSLFGEMRLSDESQAVEAWRTTLAGGYTTAGVGTGITGKGAHILIIDDPVKDQQDADSAIVRGTTWDWYLSTAYTRLAPGGGVLGIQTRWNDDDWSGRIIMAMQTGEGEQFEIASYPAINEMGDEYILPDESIVQLPPGMEVPEGAQLTRPMGSALHPDRYDLAHLGRIKRNLIASGSLRTWSALYQQNPAPDEGAFFTKDMFRYYAHELQTRGMHVYQAWDFSITEKETSDWIVGYCIAQDHDDNLFELDMVRFKSDENAFTISQGVLDFWEKWRPWLVGFEDGQIFKSIKEVLIRDARERKIPLNYETLTPLTDKLVRAGPLKGRMQMRRMYFKENAPWRQTVDMELLRFPAGRHDDIVDAAAWAVTLALRHAAPRKPPAPVIKSWKDRINGTLRGESHMAA
jgi:predicted phage terminase large subunit-like protein